MKTRARHAVKRDPLRVGLARSIPRCRAKTREGKPCPAPAALGGKYCFFHTGDNAKVKGSLGGKRRAIFNPDNLEPFPKPQNAADLMQLGFQTLVELRSARMDRGTAATLFYGIATCAKTVETAELAERVKALEERAGRRDAALRRNRAVTQAVM